MEIAVDEFLLHTIAVFRKWRFALLCALPNAADRRLHRGERENHTMAPRLNLSLFFNLGS